MPLATLLLAALPFVSPLCGQTWRPVGPAGGISGTLAASASDPGLVYLLGRSAGDNGSTLYRSTNGGQRWQRVPGPALDALLAVDARSAATLYGRLSSSGGPRPLAKSVDGGRHWAVADRGLEAAEALQAVGAPVQDPGNPGRLFTPTLLGLFESTNGAASWHVRTLQDTPVEAFTVDPRDSSHWLAGVEIAASGFCPPPAEPCIVPDVLESHDAGRTWASTGYRARPILAAPRPILTASRQLYVLAGGAVVRRSPGKPWRPAVPFPQGVLQLALAPGGTLYAATPLGVYRSTDGGDSWLPSAAKARPLDGIVSLALLPDAAETLLASGFEEIWRSADAGATWGASSAGLSGQAISSLTVAADSTVYAAPDFEGIVSSPSGDGTWRPRNSGLGVDVPPFSGNFQSFSINDLASDPHDAATVYALVTRSVTRGDLARTTDGGRSWQILPPLPTGDFYFLVSVVVDPGSSCSLYVIAQLLTSAGGGSETGVLLHSADAGASWQRVLTDGAAIATIAIGAVDPQRSATVYAWTFQQGLLKSTDSGATWQATDPTLPGVPSSSSRTLVVDPRDSQTVYAGTFHGVYVSHDGGATFTAMNSGFPGGYSRRLLLAPGPQGSPAKLYLLDQEGLFRWLADQATWVPLDNGLPAGLPLGAGDLAFDPGNPDVLYLATDGKGVYRLDVGGSP